MKGRGVVELAGVIDRVDIISSSFGKAMGGGNGSFLTGKKYLIDLVRQTASPSIGSSVIPPHLVAGYELGFKLLQNNPDILQNLQDNIRLFRTKMKSLGFVVLGDERSPICPILIGKAKFANQFSEKLLAKGIYAVGISFPFVAKDKARIMVQLSLNHSQEEIKQCIEIFEEVGRALEVIV